MSQSPNPSPGPPGDIDVGLCLSEAWANCWSNFPLWLGVGLVYLVATLASAVTVVGLFLLVPVLVFGLTLFGLKMHDGGAEFGDLWQGFSRYGEVLVAMLVLMLVLFGVAFVAGLPQGLGDGLGLGWLSAIGTLVHLAYAFLVAPRLNLAYFYLVDQGAKPLDAVSRAWQETEPVMWKMAVLMLISAAISVAGALLLLVGLIPAAAIIALMWVSAYRQLVGGPATA